MEVQRAAWDSPAVSLAIRNNEPIVLTAGCPLIGEVRWTFSTLKEIMDPGFKCDVYVSESDKFQYWDQSKNIYGYDFIPPTTKETISFQDFISEVESIRAGNDCNDIEATSASQTCDPPRPRRLYLQQSVVQEMGELVIADYSKFSLETALRFKIQGNWDALTNNLLLCGPAGVVTPLHYDEQQNMFSQLSGVKRVRLFPPESMLGLYPYPLGHPCDRQSQVPLPGIPGTCSFPEGFSHEMFPRYSPESELYVDLQPGEILYVPQYWWHQMESLTDNVSMSWWYKDQSKSKPKKEISTPPKAASVDASELHVSETLAAAGLDPSSISLVAIRRNLERLIAEGAGGGCKAHNFFLAVAGGRLKIPPDFSGVSLDIPDPLPEDVAAAVDLVLEPHWPGLLKQAVDMGAIVLKKGYAPVFLMELTAGRFNRVSCNP